MLLLTIQASHVCFDDAEPGSTQYAWSGIGELKEQVGAVGDNGGDNKTGSLLIGFNCSLVGGSRNSSLLFSVSFLS